LYLLGLLFINAPLRAEEQGLKHLDLGNSYFKEGRYKQAAEEYKTAWEDGRLVDAVYNLAFLYDLKLNNNELALRYYREYLKADPDSSELEEIEQLIKKAEDDLAIENKWRSSLADKNLQSQTEHQVIPCPIDPPTPEKEGFNNGGARACLSCHMGFMGVTINVDATHPVGHVPKGDLAETVPPEVRFYKEGAVVCLSCHDPQNIHFIEGTPGKTYKVLRVDTGPAGEEMSLFCAMCHKAQSAARFLRGNNDSEDYIPRGE
jgi:tetratricopeptide (TPR) repeat protein